MRRVATSRLRISPSRSITTKTEAEMTANTKQWLGVILSAVVLGLSVVYLINMWMPQETIDWILWAVVALVAIRSIARIAQLAKQAGQTEDKE